MDNNITIREGTYNDLNAINEIYNYYVLESTATAEETPSNINDRINWFNGLKEKGLPVIVAEINGQVIGWASVCLFNERSGYRFCVEDSVYLDKSCLKKGIGTLLMDELMKRVKSLGFKSIISKICEEQQKSVTFHEKYGFKTVGVMENAVLKFNRYLNIVIMQKVL